MYRRVPHENGTLIIFLSVLQTALSLLMLAGSVQKILALHSVCCLTQ